VRAVVDVNVPIVANRKAPQMSPDCVIACVDALKNLTETGVLLVDSLGRILDEYRTYLSPMGQPGVGDAFYKWALRNRWVAGRCEAVEVNAHAVRGFVEFPEDAALEGFDPADRMYVAVAVADGLRGEILEAADAAWLTFEPVLKELGIRVRFLCVEDLRGFKRIARVRPRA
jgi:hypothetical protein